MSAGTTIGNHEVYQNDGELCFVLKGRIILEELTALKQEIMPAITSSIKHVYIDLKNVDYVDSAGLGLLIGFKMTAKSHGSSITLMDPAKNVSDVLTISKIDSIFDFLNGRDATDVRSRLVQSEFLKPGNSTDSGTNAGLNAPGSAPLPQVNADGTFEDGDDESSQIKDAVEEHCRLAVESMRQGDYEKSIACYKSALELDEDYVPALNNLAIVYEKQPNWYPLAIETWNKVLELSRARKDSKHADRAERHLADLAG